MGLKLLLAEDDFDLRESITLALTMDGFDVTACESAEQAIGCTMRHQYDVALLDLVMEGMSGIEAIASLKKLNPNIGIVIGTAFGTIDTAVDAMKKGADEFLTKPFQLQTLSVTLKRVHAEKSLKAPTADKDSDQVFSALANPIRRNVIYQLTIHQKLKFMDLCRLVGIDDHTKFNFHLRQLIKSNLVKQEQGKSYILTKKGVDVESRLHL
ncbi:response regulator [Vibrio sp. 03-59-1]|uniref:response regulator n=1 Tax=Vibrio sp. 03-59-1 TaxID=2607607 RepID=UPI00149392F6|nr:response regulator [Vibrio sp. 03-59-1]NOH82720.1 response regulator [Vibrio sp. 03-59-1]